MAMDVVGHYRRVFEAIGNRPYQLVAAINALRHLGRVLDDLLCWAQLPTSEPLDDDWLAQFKDMIRVAVYQAEKANRYGNDIPIADDLLSQKLPQAQRLAFQFATLLQSDPKLSAIPARHWTLKAERQLFDDLADMNHWLKERAEPHAFGDYLKGQMEQERRTTDAIKTLFEPAGDKLAVIASEMPSGERTEPIPQAETPKPANVESVEYDKLNTTQKEFLQAYLSLKAINSDSSQTWKDIVKKALGPVADPDNYKRASSGLSKLGLTTGKTGVGEGNWLTEKGLRFATKANEHSN